MLAIGGGVGQIGSINTQIQRFFFLREVLPGIPGRIGDIENVTSLAME